MQNNGMECFEIVKAVAEIILSLVAIGISLKAILQTKKQIELSNKQQLFDRRIDSYNLICDLLDSYFKLKNMMNERLDLNFNYRFILRSLMEIDVLRSIIWTVDKPTDVNANQIFEEKLYWLRKQADSMPLLFENDLVNDFSQFVVLYKDLLLWLQRYNSDIERTKRTEFDKDYKEMAREKILEISKDMDDLYSKIKSEKELFELKKAIVLK